MRLFLILIFVLLTQTFCNRKEVPEPELPSSSYWGEASAERNGDLWTAHPTCWIDIIDHNTINISLDSFYLGTRQYYLREILSFTKIPPTPGQYITSNFDLDHQDKVSSHLGIWDDDQPLGGYNVIESDSNSNNIVIQSYDTISKEIIGTFNLSFTTSNPPYPSYPDTIRFKNGLFHCKVVKK